MLLCDATNGRSITNSRAGAIPAYNVLILKPLERVGVCEILPPLPHLLKFPAFSGLR